MKKLLYLTSFIVAALATNAAPTKSNLGAFNTALIDSSSSLPYDAEVQYIDTIIPAYIDTGIAPTYTCDVTIDGYWLSSGGSGVGTLLGRYMDRAGCLRYRSSSFCELCSDTQPTSGNNWLRINVKPTERHTFQMGASGVFVDGTSLFTGKTFTHPDGLQNTFKISGYNIGNTGRQGNCRIYRFVIEDGGETIMDLIPVRIGEEGAIYDKVSKRIFMNACSMGSIVTGPDKK